MDSLDQIISDIVKGERAKADLRLLLESKLVPQEPPKFLLRTKSKVSYGAKGPRRSEPHELTIWERVLKVFQAHGKKPMPVSTLYAALPKCAQCSIGTACGVLMEKKLIERIQIGVYRLI